MSIFNFNTNQTVINEFDSSLDFTTLIQNNDQQNNPIVLVSGDDVLMYLYDRIRIKKFSIPI
jgi:hypothetical protein